jgi:hypothetical protein
MMPSKAGPSYDIPELTAQEQRVRDRIGRDSSGLAKWLLKFAQASLSKLSKGDWANLEEELLLFSKGHITESSAFIVEYLPKRNRLQPLTEDEIESMQQVARAGLDQIAAHGMARFQFKDFTLTAVSDGKSQSLAVPVLQNPVEGFGYHLIHLLGQHAHRLKKCPECPRLFFSLRQHQKFCSPRCRSRAGTREFRKTHAVDKAKRRFPKR